MGQHLFSPYDKPHLNKPVTFAPQYLKTIVFWRFYSDPAHCISIPNSGGGDGRLPWGNFHGESKWYPRDRRYMLSTIFK